MKINDLLAVNLNEETGKEMLKIFRGMHHDAGMNKDMDRYILSHNWQLGNFTPDMFPSEEEFFDYDDPFDRIVDIDYSHRVDLSQPIIVGPQYSDGKYSVVDGNHRAAAAQRMGKTIRAYFPVEKTNENFENRKNESTSSSSSNNYLLQLERDKRANMLVLHILNKQTGKRTEVRGKPGYETNGYDPNDKLHQLLDKVGKSASVSDLMNGDVVSINPRHPDGASAKAATDKAYNENFADGKKPGRKGLAKRMGVNTKASVGDLRKTAKNSSGEKQRMAHWLANMKAGKEK